MVQKNTLNKNVPAQNYLLDMFIGSKDDLDHMVKCSSCGAELKGDFCSKCGFKNTESNREFQGLFKAVMIFAGVIFGLIFLAYIITEVL